MTSMQRAAQTWLENFSLNFSNQLAFARTDGNEGSTELFVRGNRPIWSLRVLQRAESWTEACHSR